MGIAVPAWLMVLVSLAYFTYFSLGLFATPAPSVISTGMSNSPSLPPFHSTSRPDSKGHLLGPTSDFADEGVTTEVCNIPIALVNHTPYDRG